MTWTNDREFVNYIRPRHIGVQGFNDDEWGEFMLIDPNNPGPAEHNQLLASIHRSIGAMHKVWTDARTLAWRNHTDTDEPVCS